jgi:hypothetical protein
MWFLQSNRFNEWRNNSSLLWIRGNRMSFPRSLYVTVNVFPGYSAGSGKSILWYAAFP